LGFRVKRLVKNFYRVFLGTPNYIYFHLPLGCYIRGRRRKFLLVSSNLSLLKDIFAYLFLLKARVPYKLRGVFYPKQILLMKSGKKRF